MLYQGKHHQLLWIHFLFAKGKNNFIYSICSRNMIKCLPVLTSADTGKKCFPFAHITRL